MRHGPLGLGLPTELLTNSWDQTKRGGMNKSRPLFFVLCFQLGWLEALRKEMTNPEFQGRSIKPLSHPSKPLRLLSFLQGAWGGKSPFATGLLPSCSGALVYGGSQRIVSTGGSVGPASPASHDCTSRRCDGDADHEKDWAAPPSIGENWPRTYA